MSKEAMKLALEALQKIYIAPEHEEYIRVWWPACEQAITALREALANEALERMAENARELGLNYDTSAGTQVSKVWWDGEKLMAKPIPLAAFYEPAHQEPVASLQEIARLHDLINDLTLDVEFLSQPAHQEPVAWIVEDQSGERLEWASDAHSCHGVPTFPLFTAPPAQRHWVGLTDEEIEQGCKESWVTEEAWQSAVWWAENKLRSKNT